MPLFLVAMPLFLVAMLHKASFSSKLCLFPSSNSLCHRGMTAGSIEMFGCQDCSKNLGFFSRRFILLWPFTQLDCNQGPSFLQNSCTSWCLDFLESSARTSRCFSSNLDVFCVLSTLSCLTTPQVVTEGMGALSTLPPIYCGVFFVVPPFSVAISCSKVLSFLGASGQHDSTGCFFGGVG